MFPLQTVYLNFFHNLWWARPKSRNGESFPERLKSHQTELVSLPPSLLPSTPSPSRKANCPTVRCDVARLLRMQCTVQQIFHCTAMHQAALGLLRCICSQCHALCTVCTVHCAFPAIRSAHPLCATSAAAKNVCTPTWWLRAHRIPPPTWLTSKDLKSLGYCTSQNVGGG